MSRALFRRLPSICEVVIGAASLPLFFLTLAIQESLQVAYGLPEILCAAEQLDDLGGLAVG
jgi:hypothetical protein